MIITSKQFVVSNSDPAKCPKVSQPEYAMVGRSNVGKSSLINMLVNSKGLAKTSSKPGKSRLINHFLINGDWYLVDLPGYGFAKVSKSERERWDRMITGYLTSRENLVSVLLLIDARLEPQDIDLGCVNWLGELGIPFVLVFTKVDKKGGRKVRQNMKLFREAMLETWEELPPMFVTSAETGQGRKAILDYIEGLNGQDAVVSAQ